jgi:hypothetical protein
MRKQREKSTTPQPALPWAESMPEGVPAAANTETPVWPRYAYRVVTHPDYVMYGGMPYMFFGYTIEPSTGQKITVKVQTAFEAIPAFVRDSLMHDGFMGLLR